jgi:predicted DNA-binding transcriptional regulator YafY
MLHQTKDSFEILQDFDLDEFLGTSFGVYVGTPVKVRILFSPEVAGFIREKVWHESQKLDPQDDGALIFEATVAGPEEVKHWILGWGSNAQVLEPEELLKEIRAEALATLKKYNRNDTVRQASLSYEETGSY